MFGGGGPGARLVEITILKLMRGEAGCGFKEPNESSKKIKFFKDTNFLY